MNEMQDFVGIGRQHLQDESYGVAAFFLQQAVQENPLDGQAWNGFLLALSLMRREEDTRTALARYGMQQGLTFDREILLFALMHWRNNPLALGEWVRAILRMKGIDTQVKTAISGMAEDLERSYGDLLKTHGAEMLRSEGMINLEETAFRQLHLERMMSIPLDTTYELIKSWLEDEEMILDGIRLLSMLPDPRSEKLLRRICRNEEIDAKARTHAMLALRWLGVRGRVRLEKFGESFIIDLDHPDPELTISVPEIFKPALDRMKLWFAKEKGLISKDEYEQYAATDDMDLPETMNVKLEEAQVPPILQEVIHAVIRAAYDEYYPLVPIPTGMRQWSGAFVSLMKSYAMSKGMDWPYGDSEQDEISTQHKNWLLSGTPNFYESIKDKRLAPSF